MDNPHAVRVRVGRCPLWHQQPPTSSRDKRTKLDRKTVHRHIRDPCGCQPSPTRSEVKREPGCGCSVQKHCSLHRRPRTTCTQESSPHSAALALAAVVAMLHEAARRLRLTERGGKHGVVREAHGVRRRGLVVGLDAGAGGKWAGRGT
eukprot:2443326-Prymnesium_polylepis.2